MSSTPDAHRQPTDLKTEPASSAPAWWFREISSAGVWVFFFIKLFIYDVDIALVDQLAPGLLPYLKFRFFVFLGALATLWLALGNKRFGSFVGYALAYPFVVLLWHLPRLLLKNWAVMIAFSPAIHSMIKTMRWNFVWMTAALWAALTIILSEARFAVGTAALVLAAYLLRHFVRRFRVAFQPATVFADAARLVRSLWGRIQSSGFAKVEYKEFETGSNEYKQKYAQNLLMLYFFATSLRYLAIRLREVLTSRKLDIYFIGSLLYTFMLTVAVFGLGFNALERFHQGSFAGVDDPRIWHFLGYSFCTIMTSDLPPLVPATGIAQAMTYLELFGSLVIIVLLVFIILTSIRERYKQDVEQVIGELGVVSGKFAAEIEANYELTLASAEAKLMEHQPEPMKMLAKILGKHLEESRLLSEGADTEKT